MADVLHGESPYKEDPAHGSPSLPGEIGGGRRQEPRQRRLADEGPVAHRDQPIRARRDLVVMGDDDDA